MQRHLFVDKGSHMNHSCREIFNSENICIKFTFSLHEEDELFVYIYALHEYN